LPDRVPQDEAGTRAIVDLFLLEARAMDPANDAVGIVPNRLVTDAVSLGPGDTTPARPRHVGDLDVARLLDDARVEGMRVRGVIHYAASQSEFGAACSVCAVVVVVVVG
jgi:hypothetical protein